MTGRTMTGRWLVPIAGVLCLVVLAAAPGAVPQQPASTNAAVAAPPRAVLDKYCVTCHSERLHTAGLVLETMDLAQVSGHAEVWEKVVRKLRTGAMPPPGRPRPDKTTSDATS